MPPVNTPQRSPTRPQTPATQTRPLTPLSYLSSPAPDLASTLYTSQTPNPPAEPDISLFQMPHNTLDSARRDTPEDLSRRERLQRVLARLNRLHEPTASSGQAYSNRTPSPNRQSLYDWAPAYEESRSQEEELDAILSELRRQQPETHPDILRVLGQSQLDGSSRNTANGNGVNESDAAQNEQRRSQQRQRERQRRESEWVSLRSRAVLQRARQEVGGGSSPSATERMLRYVMDRERSGMSEEEERARGSGWFRPTPRSGAAREEHSSNTQAWDLPPGAYPIPRRGPAPTTSTEARDRDRQERVEAFRRGYLAENVPPRLPRVRTPPMSPPPRFATRNSASLLEHTLLYLSELRSCSRYEDALSVAMDHGLATKEFFADKHDDFIMDLDELPELPFSSWLQPGTVFEGHQYASNFTGSNIAHQGPSPNTSRVEQINPNFRPPSISFDHPPGSTRVVSFDTSRHHSNSNLNLPMPLSPPNPNHDHWPVRVILHSIDPEKMTLQGTMEAYDVPQHPSSLSILNPNSERPKAGKKEKPITTYLEGHIIDLRTHSFLTPGSKREKGDSSSSLDSESNINFPTTTTATDAENWLKLSPFPSLTTPSHKSSSSPEDTLARLLLSTRTLQQLQNEYIFMRWKEKCFIHSKHDECKAPASERHGDQDRGHGLTISGFYYVSLRRSDGEVEGLYFDPLSTPYQCLRLRGKVGGWGAWGMR